MASTRRNYLVCFCCSRKSGIKYDGLITSWECTRCEATNFLDENGDITDPPAATVELAPADLKFSFSRADSPISDTSSLSFEGFARPPPSSPFCATCLKNQHLFIASLQQFHVELDPSHPEYRQSEKNYYKYRKTLEALYPQVCEDCLPNVEKGLDAAHKASKSDIIQKSLAKSKLRVRKAARGITVAGSRDFFGRSLWYIGLLAQLLWNLVVLSTFADHFLKTSSDASYPNFVFELVSAFSEASQSLPQGGSLGRWGLICSVAAIWWNPKFNNLNVGFTTHITGYKYWYKHQIILIVIRGLFYFIMGREKFADSSHSAVGAAHLFIFVFITFLAIRAHSFIKVDYTRLWSNAPSKLRHVGPGSSPKQSGESMADTIESLRVGSHMNKQAATPSVSTYKPRFKPEPYIQGSIRINERHTGPLQSMKELHVPPRPTPALFTHPLIESEQFQQSQPSLNGNYADMNLGGGGVDGDMDWSPAPSQPESQYRAFTENLPVNNDAVFFGHAKPKQHTKLFGHSPVVPDSSPFWFKVPPAPITPAHQLRNPPNQPRIRTVSQEQKQNFFSNSRSGPSEVAKSTGYEKIGSRRDEVEFAQRKFFAPDTASAGHDVLVSAMDAWSLGDSNRPIAVTGKSEARNRHVGQAIALSFALLFWNQILNNPSEYSKNIVITILIGCLCIGTRTVLDSTFFTESDLQWSIDNAAANTFKSLLGGAECTAALFGLANMWRGVEHENFGTLGNILAGEMLVHELWVLLF